MTLHANEFPIEVALVRRLLRDQMPHLADLPLELLETSGTVHVMYRLGTSLVVRLPRTDAYASGPQREARWLPMFAPRVPLQVPEFRALGTPSDAYASHWSVLEWIEGDAADQSTLANLSQAAVKLGEFVLALRQVPTEGAPEGGSYRGFGLARVDRDMRRWVGQLPDDIDRELVLLVWESCRSFDDWSGTPMWFHGDLRGDNLVARDGNLVAVIDWEGCAVGDPCADYLAAWWLFERDSREIFRTSCAADQSGWQRAMGWALFMSVAAIPYYAKTNPTFVRQARRALTEVLTDHQES